MANFGSSDIIRSAHKVPTHSNIRPTKYLAIGNKISTKPDINGKGQVILSLFGLSSSILALLRVHPPQTLIKIGNFDENMFREYDGIFFVVKE